MKRSNNISVYWYVTPRIVVSDKPAACEASAFIYQHTKVTVQFTLEQAMKAQRGSRGIALLSLTSALDGGVWSTLRPGRFTPGKDPYTLYGRLGGPQGRSRRVREISPAPVFDPRTA
jgi:hypothetical protein